MLPKIKAKPRSCHREETAVNTVVNTRSAECVGGMVNNPTSCTEKFFCGIGTEITYHFHKTDKGYGCFGKVGIFRGPVVHLKINIGVEVTSPRGIEIVTPYAL